MTDNQQQPGQQPENVDPLAHAAREATQAYDRHLRIRVIQLALIDISRTMIMPALGIIACLLALRHLGEIEAGVNCTIIVIYCVGWGMQAGRQGADLSLRREQLAELPHEEAKNTAVLELRRYRRATLSQSLRERIGPVSGLHYAFLIFCAGNLWTYLQSGYGVDWTIGLGGAAVYLAVAAVIEWMDLILVPRLYAFTEFASDPEDDEDPDD